MIDHLKLRDAEELIAKAKTTEELVAAHAALKAAVYGQRRVVKRDKKLGALAETYRELMRHWDKQKAEGVPLEARREMLKIALREAWPKSRAWHYLCEDCYDTGWVIKTCTAQNRCDGQSSFSHAWNSPMGARKRLCTLQATHEHDYATPCFCKKGGDARAVVAEAVSRSQRPTTHEEAGSSRKMTRLGR